MWKMPTTPYNHQNNQMFRQLKWLAAKKANDTAAPAAVTNKKSATQEKSNNNNNTSSTNNNINKKKTDDKKSENGSPTKKVANKKTGKEATAPAATNKKLKSSKNASADGQGKDEKPADFDDGGWFTVQSKSTKQKNKVDDLATNQTESASPKPAATNAKNNKSTKGAKVETKPLAAAAVAATPVTIAVQENGTADNLVESQTSVAQNVVENSVDAPAAAAIPAPAVDVEEAIVVNAKANEVTAHVAEKKQAAPVVPTTDDVNVVVENAIAFDELGEWTDAKPDRKRGNKKKSRKD